MIVIIILIFIAVVVVTITVSQKSKREDEREMKRLEIERRCRQAKERYDNEKSKVQEQPKEPKKSFITQDEKKSDFILSPKVGEVRDFQLNPSVKECVEQKKKTVHTTYRSEVMQVYKDNWYDGQMDFSDLSPSEARRRLKEAKEDGDWLEQEEYYGLIDAIAAGKDEQYLDKIEDMTPEQTEKWFNGNMKREINMSTTVWIAVAKKVAPIHEEFLIEEMRKKSSKSIDGFVNARKKEGYFFTERAYRLANRICSGEFDEKEKKAFLRQVLRIDNI